MPSPQILVVDDDQDNCLVIQRLLTDQGYEVDAAYDALSALKLFGDQTHDGCNRQSADSLGRLRQLGCHWMTQ